MAVSHRETVIEAMAKMKANLKNKLIVDDLAMGLSFLQRVQKVVSSPVSGAIPADGMLPTKDAIRTYTLAMIVETSEFLQTLNWKPWKDMKNLDKDRVVDEFADILAFQGIIIHYLFCLGITPGELAEAYAKKSITNIERFLGEHGDEYKQV
jgi:dimeric dUTPase (all-alpha-NTP-PPase superfamily)